MTATREPKSRATGLCWSLVCLGYFYVRKPGVGVVMGVVTAIAYFIPFSIVLLSGAYVFFPLAAFPWLFQIGHVQVLVGRWNAGLSSDGWST